MNAQTARMFVCEVNPPPLGMSFLLELLRIEDNELNSGETDIVMEQNSLSSLAPKMMILLNPDKTKNECLSVLNLINPLSTPSAALYKTVSRLPTDSSGRNTNNYFSNTITAQ